MSDIEALKAALIGFGATKVAHLEGTLLTHFENTNRILHRLQCPEHVCLAGLFHGAYGTQALHSEKILALPDGWRDEVRALIGDQAERLVFNFSVMTYDSLGKSMRSILRPGGQPVLRDRRTGELIDISREEFRELLNLKFADVLAHLPSRHEDIQFNLSVEYSAFWQVVAEYLGPLAINEWNCLLGDKLWIQPRN